MHPNQSATIKLYQREPSVQQMLSILKKNRKTKKIGIETVLEQSRRLNSPVYPDPCFWVTFCRHDKLQIICLFSLVPLLIRSL